ncbi:MAG: FMN-binding protein [Rikenellaceae bacterium]
MSQIKYIVNIIIVAMLFGAIAIGKDGRIFGNSVNETPQKSQISQLPEQAVQTTLSDGTMVINSTSLGRDVISFGGTTPVEIYIKEGIIQKVEPLDNNETPSFMNMVVRAGFLKNWNGLTVEEATEKSVDMVSGATYSSYALAQNVKLSAVYASDADLAANNPFKDLDLKTIIGIIVILTGVAITFIKPKNKIFEIVQLILNIAVLGFWCGSFLSLTQFVSWMSNGLNLSLALLSVLLLLVVIVVPLFGRKGSYCHIHCPMGSAQILLNKTPLKKIKIEPQIAKFLTNLRYYILLALLFFMWLGVGFNLMNYEIFSAFLLGSASTIVLVMAAIFLVLSLFVNRPYCRFICLTGALLTIMQKTK